MPSMHIVNSTAFLFRKRMSRTEHYNNLGPFEFELYYVIVKENFGPFASGDNKNNIVKIKYRIRKQSAAKANAHEKIQVFDR